MMILVKMIEKLEKCMNHERLMKNPTIKYSLKGDYI